VCVCVCSGEIICQQDVTTPTDPKNVNVYTDCIISSALFVCCACTSTTCVHVCIGVNYMCVYYSKEDRIKKPLLLATFLTSP